MARKAISKDQIVKLIVGAGQASPSPPVGPALGSKGVKSMDFCKVKTHPQFQPTSLPSRLQKHTITTTTTSSSSSSSSKN